MEMTPEEFAVWLEAEANRIHNSRWEMHGGSKHPRHDLEHWADALKWSARKLREHVPEASSRESEPRIAPPEAPEGIRGEAQYVFNVLTSGNVLPMYGSVRASMINVCRWVLGRE